MAIKTVLRLDIDLDQVTWLTSFCPGQLMPAKPNLDRHVKNCYDAFKNEWQLDDDF